MVRVRRSPKQDQFIREIASGLRDGGALVFSPPMRTDQHGRTWRSYDLQPGTSEAVEAEIRRLWERSR